MSYVVFILGYCFLVRMAYNADNAVSSALFALSSVCFAAVFVLLDFQSDETN